MRSENRGDLVKLMVRKPKLLCKRAHMGGTGITVELGRLRQAHAFTFAQGADVFIR
jgi:hypothetical protein